MKHLFTLISVAGVLLSGLQTYAQDFRFNRAGALTNVQSSSSSAAPSILTQPLSAIIDSGKTHSLGVVAAGPGPLSYQWFKNSQAIVGKTTATILFQPFLSSDAGSYYVRVTNVNGAVQSSTAILTVPVNQFAAALGSSAADWSFLGSYAWRVITNAADTHDGSSSVGVVNTRDDYSFFEGTVTSTQMTTLRFWARVTYGTFGGSAARFSIDDHDKGYIGNYIGNWMEYVYHLPPGTHKLKWEHTSAGSFFLDDISITPAADSDQDGMSDYF